MWQEQCYKPVTILGIWDLHISLPDQEFQPLIKVQGVSSTFYRISLNSIIDCTSDLGLLNSLFKDSWVFANVALELPVKYLIYHVNPWPCKDVTNYVFLILLFVIFCAIEIAPAISQNCFGSSLYVPLKIGIFIASTTLNGGNGGGGGEGVGVWDAGGGGGGVDVWGILGIPCVINWTTLRSVVNTAPSLSLEGGSLSGLYSGFDPSFILKNLPLHVAPNIKVTT